MWPPSSISSPRRVVSRRKADLFRPDRRIPVGAAGWRNHRHIARLRGCCVNFRVNSCGRAEHAVGSRQLVAERLRGGSMAVVPLRSCVVGASIVSARHPSHSSRALASPFEPVASLA